MGAQGLEGRAEHDSLALVKEAYRVVAPLVAVAQPDHVPAQRGSKKSVEEALLSRYACDAINVQVIFQEQSCAVLRLRQEILLCLDVRERASDPSLAEAVEPRSLPRCASSPGALADLAVPPHLCHHVKGDGRGQHSVQDGCARFDAERPDQALVVSTALRHCYDDHPSVNYLQSILDEGEDRCEG